MPATGSALLLEPISTSSLQLLDCAAMALITRSRAVDSTAPNASMVQCYGQPASAGLLITKGTSPSTIGLGYRLSAYSRFLRPRADTRLDGLRLVTDAVRPFAQGGKIFVRIHRERVTHVANPPAGDEVVGPTAVVCRGEAKTDLLALRPHSAGNDRIAETTLGIQNWKWPQLV